MDFLEYKANCVQAFVAAILSTGGPVTETLIEAAGYKVVVHQAFKIADYIIEKLKDEHEKELNELNERCKH